MEVWLVPLVAGLFGLLFGSFLNVCTLRWPQDESIVSPGSHCPKCDAPVRWFDNIPVLSWLVLRAKCRFCAEPISIQYPLVELATGVMWAGVFAAHGPTLEALRGAVFLTMLFGISVSDARFYIIPDQFSVGGAVIGVGMSFFPGGIEWRASLIGAATGYGVLWLVGAGGTWLIKKMSPGRLEEAGVDQAMGGGDIKMMMMVGSFVGAWGVGLTIFLGSVLALVVFGPIASLSKRLIPLGVFLAAAAAIAYGWGPQMVSWYLTQVVGLPA
ncbi:MAG: prepilin peptidase [Gemmatimonadetes bacterium]|jgi:leader peptidase (prepilin peptidase) / N-methyltransferase|nr:prepilin peptidase [Gemmatimonadota bacterium]